MSTPFLCYRCHREMIKQPDGHWKCSNCGKVYTPQWLKNKNLEQMWARFAATKPSHTDDQIPFDPREQ